jgi:hypothetical protein
VHRDLALPDGLSRAIARIEFKRIALEGRIERGQLRNGGLGEAEIILVNFNPGGPTAGGFGGGNG